MNRTNAIKAGFILIFCVFLTLFQPAWAAHTKHTAQINLLALNHSPWKMCTDGAGERALAACLRLGASGSGLDSTDRATALAYAGDHWLKANKLEKALATYDKAIALNSNIASIHFMRARTLALLRREVDALGAYDTALAIRPKAAQTLVHRAKLYRERKAYALALADLDRAAFYDPENGNVPFERARVYSDQRRWADSIEQSTIALKLDPTEWSSYYNRAGNRWENGDKEGALADITSYLMHAPDAKDGLQRRSFYLRNMNRHREALPDAMRLLSKAKTDPWVWYNLALVQEKLDEPDKRKAALSYDRAIAMAPNDVIYRRDKIDFLIDERRYADAAADLKTALKRFPDDARLHLELGRVSVLTGNLNAAGKALATSIRLDPGSKDAVYWSAREAMRSKRFAEALQKFEEIRRTSPDFKLAVYYVAESKRLLEQHKEAIIDYDTYIGLDPKDSDGFFGKGIALFQLENYEEAGKQFETGISLSPDNKLLRHWLMHSLMNLKRFEEAEKQFSEIETRKQMDDWAKGKKIELMNDMERPKEALALAQNLFPDGKLTQDARFERGRALALLQRIEEAIREYRLVIKDGSSKNATAYSHANLGELLFERRSFAAAHDHFSIAIALYPNDSDLKARLAAAMVASGDLAGMAEVMQRWAAQKLGKLSSSVQTELANLRKVMPPTSAIIAPGR